MKRFFTLFLLGCTFVTVAQAPAGYYNNATGTGYTLKSQLKTIITNGHSDQGYASLWNLYTEAAFRDNFYESNGSLLDVYSEVPVGPDSYEYFSTNDQCGNYSGEGDCYNREHLIPQSYFDNYQTDPMKNDPFHVVPSDGAVNGARGNFPFGVVGTANYTSTNGSKRGNNINTGYATGYTGVVFEPVDEFKGDIARSFLYFATRYENFMDDFYSTTNGTTTQAKVMFDGTTNKVFSDTFLNILLTWHTNDPVGTREMEINDEIYQYQGNRNPFIDNPSYACQIWTANCQALSLSTDSFAIANKTIVYPNPATAGLINIETETVLDMIQLININGQIIKQVQNPSSQNNRYTLELLPAGFYLLRLTAAGSSETLKVIVY